MNVAKSVDALCRDYRSWVEAPSLAPPRFLIMADEQTGDGREGFIDAREVFHSRRSAFKHAQAGGQLRRREGPAAYAGDELFSEDLY